MGLYEVKACKFTLKFEDCSWMCIAVLSIPAQLIEQQQTYLKNNQYKWLPRQSAEILKPSRRYKMVHGVCVCSVMSDSFATPRTIAYQASPPVIFSRQEYWSGLPFPPPGNLSNLEIKPASSASLLHGRQILYHREWFPVFILFIIGPFILFIFFISAFHWVTKW